MTYAQQILRYYQQLQLPQNLPPQVEVLYPFENQEVNGILDEFYNKFYNDTNRRTFLIGINPGRFGGGSTGIPFTDPIRLKEVLNIDNGFDLRAELSSKFIYKMISAIGGPDVFYRNFYFTSVSPLGFVKEGKNLNYYDIPELQRNLEPYIIEEMRKQIAFGANKIAFSLGKGKNVKYLHKLNERHHLFEKIIPLPHPRWVMQYRLKRLDEFVNEYITQLGRFID